MTEIVPGVHVVADDLGAAAPAAPSTSACWSSTAASR